MASRHAVINPGAAIAPGRQKPSGSVLDRQISMVKSATATATRSVSVGEILNDIKTGRYRKEINSIRKKYKEILRKTKDPEKAKKAVAALKKKLPAVTGSGTFSRRANEALIKHSGLLWADLDQLGGENGAVRRALKKSPHVSAGFSSPTGNGIKIIVPIHADVDRHGDSFRAVKQYVHEATGIWIDEKCQDVGRICFISDDANLWIREDAIVVDPLPPEPKPERPTQTASNAADLPLRERIATELLGELKWSPGKNGYFCRCPGIASHTNGNGPKDTIVYLDKAPTLACQHESCLKIIEAFNVQLRSRIGKAELITKTENDTIQGQLESELPKIRLPGDNRLLSKFGDECGRILKSCGLYQRGGIAMIVNDERDGLEVITSSMLRTLVERHLVCYRVRKTSGGKWIRFLRTMNADDALGVLNSKQFLSHLPKVDRIATTRLPIMRENNRIELLPNGYDAKSRTLTLSQCEYDETLPLQKAIETIDDLYSEFPFADSGRSKAVAVAAAGGVYGMSLIDRKSLRPVFIIVANAEGAGKTLLAMCAISPTHGETRIDIILNDHTEIEKKLLSALIAARPYILFDNVKGHLNSPPLEAFTTSVRYSGRILGVSKMFDGENLMTVFITGNGCTISPDLRRRSLFEELLMEEERAEERKFRRILDQGTLLELRPQILAALWAFIREWDKAGRPPSSRLHNAFPRWSQIIGGIVEFAGYGCPFEAAEIESGADLAGADMHQLVKLLAESRELIEEPVTFTFNELVECSQKHGFFEWLVGDGGDLKPSQRTKFSRLLNRYDRRLFTEGHFIIEGKGHARTYRCQPLKTSK
jgi:hypothetical protein